MKSNSNGTELNSYLLGISLEYRDKISLAPDLFAYGSKNAKVKLNISIYEVVNIC